MNKKKTKYICNTSTFIKLLTLLKIALVYLVVNNIVSEFRAIFKGLIPNGLIRKFDGLRQSKNEQEFKKNALININNQSHDASYEQVKNIVSNYRSTSVKPSNEVWQVLLDSIDRYDVCFDFYDALFVNGLMKEALLFRDKAKKLLVEALVSNKETPRVDLKKKIAAAAESDWEFDRIKDSLRIVPHNLVSQGNEGVRMYSESIQYIEIFNYENYHQMLFDKNVAILGPAKFDEAELFKELENIDVLILTNVLANSDIVNVIKGLNIKIVSYYNAFNSKRIFHNPKLSPGNDVDFSIYTDVKYAYQASQLIRKKARVFNKNPYIMCGAPQAFQSILYDLVRFNAKFIKAFGFTFYASKVSYRKGYSTPLDRVLYDLTRHDAVGNFIFAKQLFDADFFKGDKEIERILNMDNEGYLEALEGAFQIEEK